MQDDYKDSNVSIITGYLMNTTKRIAVTVNIARWSILYLSLKYQASPSRFRYYRIV